MYLLNYPFLKFLGPYIIGIILAYYFKYPINDIFFIGLNVLLLAGYALFRHYRLFLFSNIIILLILCNLSWNYTSSLLEAKPFSEAFYQTAHDVQFELAEFPKIREKTLQVQAVMLTLDSIPQRVNVMLTIAKDSQSLKLTHSDRIWAKVKLKAIEAAKNPYMFDYKNYMRLKSVHYTAYIPSGSWIFKTTYSPNNLKKKAGELRQKLVHIFQEMSFAPNELAVISAILLGEDDFLSADLRQSYANAGVSHILCVSGMHLGIIYSVVYFLLSFLGRTYFQKIIKSILILGVIWFYAALTGLSPSITRAATMFSFVIVSQILKRETNIYYSLGASLCFLLIYNPLYLFQLSFQLSYLAIFGIVWFQSFITENIKVKSKILRYIRDLSAVSFSAQLLTGPLAVYYFHQFPNYFILSNLSLIFISTVALIGGIVVLCCSPFSFLSSFLSKILGAIVWLMNFIILKINEIPYSVTDHISMDLMQTIMLYISILALLLILKFKNRKACFVFLVSLMLLFSEKCFQQYQSLNTSEFIIYAVPKHQLIQFKNGNKSLIYKDTLCDFEYYVQNYNRIHHLKPEILTIENGQGFNFKRLKILFIGQNVNFKEFSQRQNVDMVWLSKNASVSLKNMIKYIKPQLIIFDLGNKESYVKAKIKECKALNIPYYSMYEQKCYRRKIN